MGEFQVIINPIADIDIKKHLKSGNQASIKKIAKILIELSETPYIGVGKPEELKHELTGFWSRQVNSKDRLIYKVDENIVTVIVFSVSGHYSDK